MAGYSLHTALPSFSTDDDNDTEVEAIEVDTELNLVTECWVEPQSGHVHSTAENWRHFQGLPYQKIPKAVSLPRAAAPMELQGGWGLLLTGPRGWGRGGDMGP